MAEMTQEDYWRDGTALIERQRKECIAHARGPDWYSHAPMGMSPDQARGYLAGKIDAWQHALEMMGHPEILNAIAPVRRK